MPKRVKFPKITQRDPGGCPVATEQVLRGALNRGVVDVVVVGRMKDGSMYVASALNADAARTAKRMFIVIQHYLATHGYERRVVKDVGPAGR